MFGKATLFTVALAFVASASPIAREPSGVRVPLAKRSSLTNADGTFNHERAVREIVKIKNKHRQNLINLEKNVGRQAFAKGAEIKPLATLPEAFQKRDAVNLPDQGTQWTTNLTIGSPPQSFLIEVDTGSADLWVPSSSCTTCANHATYNPSASLDSIQQNGTVQISHGNTSTASGFPYTDTITVGDVTVTKQFFAVVTEESSGFQPGPADGVLGFSFPVLSNLGHHNSFFFMAVKQGTAPTPQFSLKVADSGSELCIGCVNNNLFSGALETHAIAGSSGLWQIGGASVSVGGKTVQSKFQTALDSGSAMITAPTSDAQAFWSTVEGAQVYDESQGLYSYPCDSPPEVAFRWGVKSHWNISADALNIGETESGSGVCVGAIVGGDLGLGDDVWLLGDAFMKNVYTVFDVDQLSLGFGQLV